MCPRPTTTHLVSGRIQSAALASPLRMEIIGFFENRRELSVRDVAERLGRPVSSMYFHVKKLVQAGLLIQGSTRGTGSGAEVLYRAVADRIALQVNPRSASSVHATVLAMRALLRQVGREFETACRSPSHFAGQCEGDAIGRRQRVWLTRQDAEQVRERLDAVERFLITRNGKPGGVEYTWTSLLIPVAKPRRRAVKLRNQQKP